MNQQQLLVLQRTNSSSVSSNIAKFIPTRSIIKFENGSIRSAASDQKSKIVKPRKKSVRFADMILIGDEQDQIQMFLSDEEQSIIEKKSTPTKLNQ